MRPPSIGSTRCMIYKPKQRRLDDGCLACNGSQTWCDSIAPDNCCTLCSHTKTALDDAHTPTED